MKPNFLFYFIIIYMLSLGSILYGEEITFTNQYLKKAIEYYKDDDIKEALKELNKAKETPGNTTDDNAYIYIYYGTIYTILGQEKEAYDSFLKALKFKCNVKMIESSPEIMAIFNRARSNYTLQVGPCDINPPTIIDQIPESISGLKISLIDLKIQDESGVEKVTFSYKPLGDKGDFKTYQMLKKGENIYSIEIDGTKISGDAIAYYIETLDIKGNKGNIGTKGEPNIMKIDKTPPEISIPPLIGSYSSKDSIPIKVTVIDDSGIERVTLFFKGSSSPTLFQSKKLEAMKGNSFEGVIKPNEFEGNIEYYIEAVDKAQHSTKSSIQKIIIKSPSLWASKTTWKWTTLGTTVLTGVLSGIFYKGALSEGDKAKEADSLSEWEDHKNSGNSKYYMSLAFLGLSLASAGTSGYLFYSDSVSHSALIEQQRSNFYVDIKGDDIYIMGGVKYNW